MSGGAVAVGVVLVLVSGPILVEVKSFRLRVALLVWLSVLTTQAVVIFNEFGSAK